MDDASLPAGWQVWHEEREGRLILAYRPDIFDSEAFPAACMPTIYVTSGSPRRRPGADGGDSGWEVTLFLEPEIEATTEQYDDREAALAGATDIAGRFADGAVDYRELYQVPREDYFEKLDELVG